jgi:DNA ligase-associated metallophosphoesterase
MTGKPDTSAEIRLNGASLTADPSGALLWPARATLVVADLHLEKGSAFAARGQFLPPYDTRATLDRLAALLDRHRPERVVCLGDSFHDGAAGERIAATDRARLRRLSAGRDWIWIAGNHDPEPPDGLGGRVLEDLIDGPLAFRHQARAKPAPAGEVSGHWHPKAAVRLPPKRITAPCFVGDGRRLVLPAFGAYTGGLNVLDRAVSALFRPNFRVHLLHRGRLYPFARESLVG